MARVLAVILAASLLSACANAIDPPSYLGMSTGSIEGGQASQSEATPSAIRHVSSNRVLGAMAFKKVTGADVDPRSLSAPNQP